MCVFLLLSTKSNQQTLLPKTNFKLVTSRQKV